MAGGSLIEAVKKGDRQLCLELVESGNDQLVDSVDNDGNTALHIACERSDIKCVQVILPKSNPFLPNYYGKKAIDLAKDHKIRKLILGTY